MRPVLRREQSTLDRLDQVSLSRHPALGLVFVSPLNLEATHSQVSHTNAVALLEMHAILQRLSIRNPASKDPRSASCAQTKSHIPDFSLTRNQRDRLEPVPRIGQLAEPVPSIHRTDKNLGGFLIPRRSCFSRVLGIDRSLYH